MKRTRQSAVKQKPDALDLPADLPMDENPKRMTQGQYIVEMLESRNATDTERFWYSRPHRNGLSEAIELKKFSPYRLRKVRWRT